MALIVLSAWPKTVLTSHAAARVTDACGRAVALPELMRNAVLFTPTIAEYLFVTRDPDPIISGYQTNWNSVSESIFSRIYPQLNSPRINSGIDPGLISTETLFVLKPDVIFDWDFRAPYFGDLGLPAVCVSNRRGEEAGLVVNARLYGDVMNQPGRADALISQYHEALGGLSDVVEHLTRQPNPRILSITLNENGRIQASRSLLYRDILAMAGAEDASRPYGSSFINAETVLLLDPDILILDPSPIRYEGPSPFAFMQSAMWQPLKAVRNRHVYNRPLGASLFFVGIVETPLFARWIAELLHSDMPPTLRSSMRDAYRKELHYTVSDTELDQMLAVERNHLSANHERFEKTRDSPARH